MPTPYRVTGMTCGGCARALTQAIAEIAPEAVVAIDLETKVVTIDGADEAQVRAAVDQAGFGFEGRV
jgi:copper chaperone